MRVAINGNRHQEGHFGQIERLVNTLVKRGDDVVIAEVFLDYLEANIGPRFGFGLDRMPLTGRPHADLAISIGGDGAFLKTARWIGEESAPVAGINTGHLGYLSAFTFDNEEEIYNSLLAGKCPVEQRALIDVTLSGDASHHPLHALNEIAITRGDNAAMLNLAVTIDGTSSLNYLGDGLIIATPTGSTAYNLSVGGPILAPTLEGWVISPIAAHSLSMRPLVVSSRSEIRISVDTRGTGYRLSVDGKSQSLPLDTQLVVTRAPFNVNLVVQPGHAFTDTLRDKLGMGRVR